MTKKIFLFIFLILIVGIVFFHFNEKDNNIKNNNKREIIEKTTEKSEYYNCKRDYICEKINDIEYKWTTKTQIKIDNEYNHDNDELEAGKVEINEDGKLVFTNLDNEILITYNINDEVIALEESLDLCSEGRIIIALTLSGKLYMSDSQIGLLNENTFMEIEDENNFTHFFTKINKEDYTCIVTEIYAKNNKGEIIKILSNENLI